MTIIYTPYTTILQELKNKKNMLPYLQGLYHIENALSLRDVDSFIEVTLLPLPTYPLRSCQCSLCITPGLYIQMT